ncbi:MAG TPA: hypothetical protein VFK69_02545, partial [Candidatus Eisenbacteria bacterium]|nr:hypothetical protein [Candidatus Eisenbacteria bacterium]
MNTPEDSDNRSDTPGQKPGGPYISPRLREKLQGGPEFGDDDFEIKPGSPVGMIVGIAVVIVAIVGGIAWMHHASAVKKAKDLVEAQKAAVAARADSIAHAQQADSLARIAAVNDSIAAVQAKKHGKTPAP